MDDIKGFMNDFKDIIDDYDPSKHIKFNRAQILDKQPKLPSVGKKLYQISSN